MGSNCLQSNLSIIHKRQGFSDCTNHGLFNKGKYSHLKSYLDPDITNSWSLLNEIDLISFFNKTKVIFFRKTAFNYNAVLNIIFIAALRGEEMSN